MNKTLVNVHMPVVGYLRTCMSKAYNTSCWFIKDHGIECAYSCITHAKHCAAGVCKKSNTNQAASFAKLKDKVQRFYSFCI